jgi:hypothetical protein
LEGTNVKQALGKISATALGAAMVLGAAGTAYAGNYVNYQTHVTHYSSGGGWAAGVVSAARNSSNASEYIGCQVATYSSGAAYGTCYATDAANASVYCSSSNAALIAQMRAISDNSYVQFAADPSGACTTVYVHQSSRYTAASGGSSPLLPIYTVGG